MVMVMVIESDWVIDGDGDDDRRPPDHRTRSAASFLILRIATTAGKYKLCLAHACSSRAVIELSIRLGGENRYLDHT